MDLWSIALFPVFTVLLCTYLVEAEDDEGEEEQSEDGGEEPHPPGNRAVRHLRGEHLGGHLVGLPN